MLKQLFKRFNPTKTSSTSPSAAKPTVAPPPILDVTDGDFAQWVEASELPVVVDVWAEWCQPCQIMSAYVGFLAKEFEGRLLVTALDADENPQVSERFNIMGLPTLLFMKDGQEVDRIVGVVEYAAIKSKTESILLLD